MSQQSCQKVQNERVSQVLKMLQEGQPREKIADQFGYSTWKSLDIYMRRHGFLWDSQRNLYTLTVQDTKTNERFDSISVEIDPEEIVRLFSIGILDSREIAKRTGFSGHKEMAAYMLRQGYIWSADSMNYINKNAAPTRVNHEECGESLDEDKEVLTNNLASGNENLNLKYKSLLEFLWQSRDQLIKVIESMNTENQVRIYTIPGKAKTKSIFLSDDLADLMLALCQKQNLSQRQGYEAALVEYLVKYGYQDKIELLLNSQENLETPHV